MDIRVRNAGVDDIGALAGLLGELFAIEADFAVDAARQQRGLRLLLDGCRKHRCVKVAETDGRVVGMCAAQTLISTAEGGVVALIEDVVVSGTHRGRGIGRLLMRSIEDWACDRGATRLQLLADRTNAPALGFYDRIGWRRTRMICLRKGGLPSAAE